MVVTKWDMAIGMVKSDDLPKFMQYMQTEITTQKL
jgi:hypothetical protein